MTRRIHAIFLSTLILASAAACSTDDSGQTIPRQTDNTVRTAEPNEDQMIPTTVDKEEPLIHADTVLLFDAAEAAIRVTGIEQQERGMYHPLTFHWGESAHTFEWENVTNPTYAPDLTLTDLDKDGQDEIILVLTTGYGTGFYASEARVLQTDLTEISLPDPLEAANDVIKYKALVLNDKRTFTLTVNGESYAYTYQDDATGMWFDRVVLDNHRRYRVENGQVIASMAAELGHGVSPGRIEVAYELKEGQFEMTGVRFVEENSD